VDLRLSVRAGRSCSVVEVGGEVDMATSPQLHHFLQDVADGGAPRVVLDCTDLLFMDSSGLGVLMVWFKQLRAEGGRLCIASVRQPVKYVLRVSAVDQVVDVYDTVAAAEASMPPTPS
jgi:anti-sigma B factor antagonist